MAAEHADPDPELEEEVEAETFEKDHESVYEALFAARSEFPKLQRASNNPHFKSKYTSLETLMEVVDPILLRHGLLWTTMPGFTGQETPILKYEMLHVPSATEVCEEVLLLAAKDDPQGQSAAITYARRYTIEAVLGLIGTDDDDGNRASEAARGARGRMEDTRPLSPEELARMMEAITASGLDLEEVMRVAGIAEIDKVTVEAARRVKELLERHAAPAADGEPAA
jgi:hypothetical protein